MKKPIKDHRGNIVGYMEEEKPEVKPIAKKVEIKKPKPKPTVKKEKSDNLK